MSYNVTACVVLGWNCQSHGEECFTVEGKNIPSHEETYWDEDCYGGLRLCHGGYDCETSVFGLPSESVGDDDAGIIMESKFPQITSELRDFQKKWDLPSPTKMVVVSGG